MGLTTGQRVSCTFYPEKAKKTPLFENISENDAKPSVPIVQRCSTDEFYNRLITEAPYIIGDKEPLIPAKDIPWLNLQLLNEGLKFYRQNLFSIQLVNTGAFMYGFSVKPESIVLLRSGKFHRIDNSFKRYLSTSRRIGNWLRHGVTSENSESYKQLKMVRSLHNYYGRSEAPLPTIDDMDRCPEGAEIIEAIRKDMEYKEIPDAPHHLLTWEPPLPFSQFDMALTQFGFIGLIYLYPKSVGIRDLSQFDGFCHLWAVIGRMLGLEDRFNLGIYPDKKVIRKIYVNVGLASLKSTDETVINLQYSLIEGLSRRLPVITLKTFVYYGLSEHDEDFKGEHLWKIMSIRDKACYYGLKGTFKLVTNCSFVRIGINILLTLLLQFAYWIYLPTSCACPM